MRSFLIFVLYITFTSNYVITNETLKFLEEKKVPNKVDPDSSRTFEEIVLARGYPLETHYVTTEDGYILKLFRIPGKKGSSVVNQKPCLLMHGVLDSSDSWVIHYEDKSHSYSLVNNGYDVWMGNVRGNKHSRKHVRLNPDIDNEFWEFSHHEMGVKDLPAMIDYILLKTKKEKLAYVGHSQGTSIVFLAMATNPKYFKEKLTGVVALGPVTRLTNINSTFLYLVVKSKLDSILYYLGMREFLPDMGAVNHLISILCDKLKIICNGVLNMIADANPEDDDQDKFLVLLSHFPSGTSLLDLRHYAQNVRNGKFEPYDYGSSKNLEKYGKAYPEEYKLKDIENKVCIFVGEHDRISTIEDNKWLRSQLNPSILLKYRELKKMGHLTYFLSKDFSYNNDVLDCLNEFGKN